MLPTVFLSLSSADESFVTRVHQLLPDVSNASMSLMCAASRNLSPPNLTNGIFRRVSSISSGPQEQDRLLFQQYSRLPVLKHALDDEPCLIGVVAYAHELGPGAGSAICPEVW